MIPTFFPAQTPGADIKPIEKGWQLSIPKGEAGSYRLAQVDDYKPLTRGAFPWQPPLIIRLSARASAADLPGTWGFGLWNDPFSLSLGLGGGTRSIPALPNAAWFFFASPPNYLSLRDDLPAVGALAATFRAPQLPTILYLLAAPLLALMTLPPLARLARRMGRRIALQSSAAMTHDPTGWHEYTLDWQADTVSFRVDGERVLKTDVSPRGPLGFVMWIDNQYAALPPDGRLRYGTLANPAAWIEIKDLEITQQDG